VKLLLKDRRRTVNDLKDALRIACAKDYASIVRELLLHEQINFIGDLNWALSLVLKNGNTEAFNVLIKDRRFKLKYSMLWVVCSSGNLQSLKQILKTKKLDPSASNNRALKEAKSKNHHLIVSELMKEDRVRQLVRQSHSHPSKPTKFKNSAGLLLVTILFVILIGVISLGVH